MIYKDSFFQEKKVQLNDVIFGKVNHITFKPISYILKNLLQYFKLLERSKQYTNERI